MNEPFSFARKVLSFSGGAASLKKVSITEKPLTGENEDTFTQRLLEKYRKSRGTIEMVLKNGNPDYARQDSEFRLIYHGTIVQRYGLDLAIQAVDRVRADIPNIHLTILTQVATLIP